MKSRYARYGLSVNWLNLRDGIRLGRDGTLLMAVQMEKLIFYAKSEFGNNIKSWNIIKPLRNDLQTTPEC